MDTQTFLSVRQMVCARGPLIGTRTVCTEMITILIPDKSKNVIVSVILQNKFLLEFRDVIIIRGGLHELLHFSRINAARDLKL